MNAQEQERLQGEAWKHELEQRLDHIAESVEWLKANPFCSAQEYADKGLHNGETR